MNNPNLTWKEYSANKISHSVAHYLMTLRDLKATRGYARVTDLADALGVTKGTVSGQVRQLKDRGFVVEDDAHHLCLTDAGEAAARQVLYNRGTLIRFLSTVLGVEPGQAEIDACKMEHLLSPETGHKLLELVQLLLSSDPSAARLLAKLETTTPSESTAHPRAATTEKADDDAGSPEG